MKTYRYLISVLIPAWFLLVLTLSALGRFTNAYNRLGISVAVAASVPLIAFLLWFSVSRSFRDYSMSLSPAFLTAAQSFRLVGFIFVLLEAHHSLPAIFALPAGYGDMFIGATATFAAWKLAGDKRRVPFIAWQLLGVADLVTAVALGVTSPLLDPHGIPVTLMTVLPLSLVPTFFVPLYLIFHVISIAQARQWETTSIRRDHQLGPVHPAAI